MRIRTIFQLVPFCLVVLATAGTALAGTTPYRVAVTSATDTAFTVTWVTTSSETGRVLYGTSAGSLSSTAYDTRGTTTSSTVHHVVISGLTAGTTYHFKIVSGGTTYGDSGGSAYSFKTGSSLILLGSNFIKGKVKKSGGIVAAAGVLVHVTLKDGDSSGSSGSSQTRTAVTSSTGEWIFSLESFRTADLIGGFSVSGTGDKIEVSADGGSLGTDLVSVDTSNAGSSPTAIASTLTAPGVPAVTDVSPSQGTNTVTTDVTGTDFLFATGAALDDGAGTGLTSFTVVSDTEITATVPAGVATGSYNVKVTSPDGTNTTSSVKFVATKPPSITDSVLPPWTSGRPYSRAVATTGGASPFTWTLISGTLHTGLSLSADGVIGGTPSITGTRAFTVRVTDNSGVKDERELSLTVASPVTTPSGVLPDWTSGRSYGNRTFTTTGGTLPIAWTVTGLPAGLGASGSRRTLTISGTPSATGTFSVTITATDAAGSTAAVSVGPVMSGPVTTPTGSLPDWTSGVAYGSRKLTTTGGTAPITFSVTGLLAALSGSPSDRTLTITGTPLTTGTYSVKLTATDSVGSTRRGPIRS